MVNMLKFLLLGFLMLGLRAQVPAIPCKGGDDCCDNVTCGLGEGDCDSHEDCVGHLRCGDNNCDGPGFDSTDDCCWEDPDFPRPPDESFEDFIMCETRRKFEQNILHSAAALGCEFAKDVGRDISLYECSQISCSSKLLGESFTCNNQNKEETCTELENLHIDVQDRIDTQCTEMLRSSVAVEDCDKFWCNLCRFRFVKPPERRQRYRAMCLIRKLASNCEEKCKTCCTKPAFGFTEAQCGGICGFTCHPSDPKFPDCHLG